MELMFEHDNNGNTPTDEMYNTVCKDLNITLLSPIYLHDDFKLNYGRMPVLFEGTLETLELLQEKYQLGLISNGLTKSQYIKLDATGLRGFFGSIKISEEFGITKPDPQIFTSCLEELDVDAEDSLFVGDHPQHDIEAAKNVGLRAVWVESEFHDEPADHDGVIANLAELPAVIDELNA